MFFSYIDNLEPIIHNYDTYIVDLWGVIHNGKELYPHVKICLEHLKKHTKKVYFLSNAPRRAAAVQEQIAKLGITPDLYTGLYTSGEDTYEIISQNKENFYKAKGKKVYPLSLKSHEPLYDDLKLEKVKDIKEASFLFNTGPDINDLKDFEEILHAALHFSLPMVCVNPDISVIAEGQVILCAGALAKRYEEIGGHVKYHGKPYAEIYDHLFERIGLKDRSRVLMIGDSLVTDIQGAKAARIDSALVRTGLCGYTYGTEPEAQNRLEQSMTEKMIFSTYILPELKF